jgi:hypothetical protein
LRAGWSAVCIPEYRYVRARPFVFIGIGSTLHSRFYNSSYSQRTEQFRKMCCLGFRELLDKGTSGLAESYFIIRVPVPLLQHSARQRATFSTSWTVFGTRPSSKYASTHWLIYAVSPIELCQKRLGFGTPFEARRQVNSKVCACTAANIIQHPYS